MFSLILQTYPCFWPADEGEQSSETYDGFSVEMISEQMDGDIYSKRLNLSSADVRAMNILIISSYDIVFCHILLFCIYYLLYACSDSVVVGTSGS